MRPLPQRVYGKHAQRLPAQLSALTMAEVFEIIVQGHIDREWEDVFEEFTFEHLPDGTTLLRGKVVDQPALQGILMRINSLGWKLLKVEQIRNE